MGVNDKQKALELALSKIEKDFGKEAIVRLGSDLKKGLLVDSISTGALALDMATGVNGVPRGRIVEIYGPEASGKTSLCLHVVASAQKSGGNAAYIDAEHALDPQYAKKLGVDLDKLLISQPDSGEQALEIAETLVRSGALDVLVIDSVAALVPRAEIEGEMGDTHVGLQARLMSQALRKLASLISRSKTCIMFINQLRYKIGMGAFMGNPETTPGGLALKFYSSMRLDIRRIETLKQADKVIGTRVRVKIVKNKVAPPYRQAEFEMLHDEGISKEGGVIDIGVQSGIITKSGTWFLYKGDQLGQGREQTRKHLRENPKLCEELRQGIIKAIYGEPINNPGKPDAKKPKHAESAKA
ncbi:recombinase RecA [Elusimicrobiota bacterium]